MSLSQFITNKVMGIDDTLEDSYTYSDKDSKYIGILFIVGILLEILTRLNIRSLKTVLGNIYWILVAVYGGIALLLMVIISTMKRENILKKREDLIQVYEILQKLVDKKGEGLDFNNVPFELGYKYGEIQKISVQVDPVSFTGGDKLLIPIVGQLDNFLPTFKWNYSTSRLNERILEFIGEDKPPTIARWPGSWLRYFRFMPMGIAGKGEVGFKPDSIPKGEEGRSQFIDENGNPIPGVLDMPNAPQGMVSGATGGGKSVAVQNIIMHCIEHSDKIALGLIDPKNVEFAGYNGMKGIVGVATNTLESVELLRIARQVMLKRNREMSKMGIKNIGEYRPQHKTDKVFITGREYNENDLIRVRIDGQEQQMTAKELVEYLNED